MLENHDGPGAGRSVRRSWLLPAIVCAACLGAAPLAPQQDPPPSPQSLRELGDETLTKAAEGWRTAIRDSRQVADVVCLVPTREAFLQALSNWDDKTYFPILMDDTEYAVKFIRAFRPRKVIRFPERSAPLPDDAVWVASLSSAVRAVLPQDEKPRSVVRGNIFWLQKQPRAPGIVLTKGGPDSIAAAALAAGRKQGLLLWPEDKGWKDVLSFEEATGRLGGLDALTKNLKAETDKLGDDLDFVTLVGDMPYRYQTPQGVNCLDDLLCRLPDGERTRRWAYVGRIVGSLESQIYQVMCGLFLQPADGLTFNGYDPADARFAGYSLNSAQARLSQAGLKVAHVGAGTIGAWHKAFLPKNSAGLLMINTSGTPNTFNLRGGAGTTWDVPWTDPTRIHIIHSFSAADVSDPYTIAGRWLANGAYAYYGSVNEPYLQSFRSPGLVADCLTEGMPWAAAVRQNPGKELFGQPWRLIVFGDPMMTFVAPSRVPARVKFDHVETWPAFAFEPLLPADASDLAKLAWSVRQTMVWATQATARQEPGAILTVLKSVKRVELPESFRPTRDELIAHLALETSQYKTAMDLAEDVPAAQRSPKLIRMIESAAIVRFQQSMGRGSLEDALPAWKAIVLVCASDEMRGPITDPIRKAVNSPIKRRIWIRSLEDLKNRPELDPKIRKWAEDLIVEAENLTL